MISSSQSEGTIILLDKPLRWTSFDVVKKVRGLLINELKKSSVGKNPRFKVGHAGTLDPLATGLLILCTGKLTKKISEIQSEEKEYTGTMMFGSTTPSYDLETKPDHFFETNHLTEKMIFEATKNFTGKILQTAPAHSAKKIDGQRAYELARRGKEVNLEPKEIEIREFEITKIDLPEISFKVICSKGTYIRSLVHDFGKHLGSGAHLTALCRTRIGNYLLEDAVTPEEFEKQFALQSPASF